MSTQHLFAFYFEQLSIMLDADQKALVVDQRELIHRITHVVRVRRGEFFILFDRAQHAQVCLEQTTKNELHCSIHVVEKNKELTPHITVLLPILKKNYLEEAISGLTEVGVNEITLLVTERSNQSVPESEFKRLQKIIIAAAEQSKQFQFPLLLMPQSYEQAIARPADAKIFLDPEGDAAVQTMKQVSVMHDLSSIMVLVGPESDLTEREKQTLREHHFMFMQLTPTILLASKAVVLGSGFLRMVML